MCVQMQKTQHYQDTLKNKVRWLGSLDIKAYFEPRNAVWMQYRGRQTDQGNKVKNSEADIFIYRHLNNAQVTLQRSGKMRNGSPSVSDAGPTGYPPAKKKEKEIGSLPNFTYKNQFWWITESSVLMDVLTTSYPKGTIPDFQCLLNLMLQILLPWLIPSNWCEVAECRVRGIKMHRRTT